MQNTRDTKDYILIDMIEKKSRDNYKKHHVDSDKYYALQHRYSQLVRKNRGINKGDRGFTLDSEKFAAYLTEKRLKAIIFKGDIHLYNQSMGIYESVDNTYLLKCMKEILDEAECKVWNRGRQGEYLEVFRLSLRHVETHIQEPFKLVLANGVLDIDKYCRNQTCISSFSPDNTFFTKLPVAYDANAGCTLFRKTLDDIFNNDKEMIKVFQEMLGYLLYYGESYKIQKFFVFYGKGSNGKSLLCSIIRRLLGDQNCSSTYLDMLQERFSLQAMYRKMVNISPEAEQKKLIDTGTIKALCGGDALTYEFKHQAAFSERNFTKLVICTNHPIKSNDTSRGFFRRLCVFPFDNRYIELKEGEEAKSNVKYMDVELEEKLIHELPGILNFALEGLKRLIQNNWKMTDSRRIQQIQDRYYYEANDIEAFVEDNILFEESGKVKTSDIYKLYSDWYTTILKGSGKKNNTDFHRQFKKYLESEGVIWELKEIRGHQHYYGITIKND